MQAIFAQEEGERKQHLHVQSAAVLLLANYGDLKRDIVALLRLLCGFRTGDVYKCVIGLELHHKDTEMQPGLRKITTEGLFGYRCKQRYTSSTYRCAHQKRALQPLCWIWLCFLHARWHHCVAGSRVAGPLPASLMSSRSRACHATACAAVFALNAPWVARP